MYLSFMRSQLCNVFDQSHKDEIYIRGSLCLCNCKNIYFVLNQIFSIHLFVNYNGMDW